MIFVNFKTYQQGTGKAALTLVQKCAQVEKETGIKIVPIVQTADLRLVSKFAVFTQHLDDVGFGPYTGKILPQGVIEAGAKGTLLNHSENKIPVEVIGSTIQELRSIKKDFKILVCSESLEEAQEIIQFKPDFIAYEPPELIGGEVSVSSAQPEIISGFTKVIKEIPVLVGAGVRNKEDVKKALQFKAAGVLVSSGVVLAEDAKGQLLKLALGFKNE